MWLFPFGLCRRRCTVACAHRWRWLRSHFRKEKGADDDLDVEKGSQFQVELSEAAGAHPFLSSLANTQDADERPGGVSDVPSWQIPELVVECPKRPGARIHKGTSLILPEAGGDLLACVVSSLPVLLQIRPRWILGYSMAVDGVSLRTMYRQLADSGPCVMIVEDSSNCIFGAFLSEGLRPVSQCYGTHECFVFRTPRTAGAWRTEVYGRTVQVASPLKADEAKQEAEATQPSPPPPDQSPTFAGFSGEKANYFEALRKSQVPASYASVFCSHMGIVVGIDGPALFIDQDLLRGVSWPSTGFGSPSLCTAGTDFVVRNLEVWHWAS